MNKKISFFLLVSLLNSAIVIAYPYFPACKTFNKNATLLTTFNGKVQGGCFNVTVNYASKPTANIPIVTFLGVPYAQPPIGIHTWCYFLLNFIIIDLYKNR